MAEENGRKPSDISLALRVLVDLREEPDKSGPAARGAILGPVNHVADVLSSYIDIGVNHFVLLPQARTLDDVQRTITMLAEKVFPQIRN